MGEELEELGAGLGVLAEVGEEGVVGVVGVGDQGSTGGAAGFRGWGRAMGLPGWMGGRAAGAGKVWGGGGSQLDQLYCGRGLPEGPEGDWAMALEPSCAKASKSWEILAREGSSEVGREKAGVAGAVGTAKLGSRCSSAGESSTTSMLWSTSSVSEEAGGVRSNTANTKPWRPMDTKLARKVGCFQKRGPVRKIREGAVMAGSGEMEVR